MRYALDYAKVCASAFTCFVPWLALTKWPITTHFLSLPLQHSFTCKLLQVATINDCWATNSINDIKYKSLFSIKSRVTNCVTIIIEF